MALRLGIDGAALFDGAAAMMLPEAQVALQRDHSRRSHEQVAQLGDAWYARRQEQDAAAFRDMLGRIPAAARGLTLELGAGEGRGYPILTSMGFAPLIGLELLPEHAAQAHQWYGYDVQVGPMEALPSLFQANAFDVVTSRHTLEHTSDPTATLSGIWKVLKSGGYTAHAVPATTWMVNEPAHLTAWWWSQWRPAFVAAGFMIVDARYVREFAEPELHMIFRKPE
jgi:SAM-dependent methyltransferase